MGRHRAQERYWQRQQAQTPPRVVPAAQMMSQMAHAARAAAAQHEQLLAQGWVYDAELRHYTHPDRPDDLIMNG